ncbi:hypothetical protein CHS0354_031403 [Potamilus streckersoni]|uniref:Uncharacterized protein n=1 Tax=Potamilus streckersoni TaxID=2493646 RepID=A0AAE0VY71_9BIVA|nr:hypothetical protein CHS0354_031403 [Potamilus streckersoni]
MTLFLSPSNINFTNCIDHVTMPDLTMNKKIMDITRKFIARGSYPKLQVVEKDGHYFTLNDTKLMIFRHLEKMGQCEYVQVEKVSRKDVPEGIRNMMTLPSDPESEYKTKGEVKRKKKGKYQSVLTSDSGHEETNGSGVEESESSDSSDSYDDFYDWSEEDADDTEIDSSSEEEEQNANESVA